MNYKNHRKIMLLTLLLIILASCSSAQEKNNNYDPKDTFINSNDPWEPMNKRVYYFNSVADKYVLLPIVDAYKYITPDPLERGIDNALNNLGDVIVISNNAAQGNMRSSLITANRLVINTIFGLGGLFDVADNLGFKKQRGTFGMTLQRYGVPTGPYLVLPLGGPSTLRDGVGSGVDAAIGFFTLPAVPALAGLRAVNSRAQVSFEYYESGSPLEYELTRYLYFKRDEIYKLQLEGPEALEK